MRAAWADIANGVLAVDVAIAAGALSVPEEIGPSGPGRSVSSVDPVP